MKHVKLDSTDRTILRLLQESGRLANIDLAQKVGLSAPTCLRRVRALESAGYIRGYHADIVAEKMGFGLTVFVLVALNNHAESDLAHFAKIVDGWPEVRACHMLTGDSDFLLHILTEDWEAFQKFLTSRLTTVPNVAHVKSFPAMRRTKHETGVLIEKEAQTANLNTLATPNT